MMKDEAGGKIIEEFVGLKPKLYSIKMARSAWPQGGLHEIGKEDKNAKESRNQSSKKQSHTKISKTV